jgi:hypothetical protein
MQAFDFGKFVIKDNNAQYTIVMAPDGTETYHAKFVPFFQGHQAIMALTDFPPNTSIAITAVNAVLSPLGGGPSFDIISFAFDPANPVTDGTGALTLNVGATLRSTGSGVQYNDDDYAGTWFMTFNY